MGPKNNFRSGWNDSSRLFFSTYDDQDLSRITTIPLLTNWACEVMALDHKDLPDDAESLIELCKQVQKDFGKLKDRYESALKTVPELRRYEQKLAFPSAGKSFELPNTSVWAELMNILWDRHQIGYPPVFGKVRDSCHLRIDEINRWHQFSFSDLAGLPKSVREDMFTKQEIVAIGGIAKLREEAFEKYELLGCICTKAALEGIKLPKNCTKELTGTILQGRHWPDEELEQPSMEQTPTERRTQAVPEDLPKPRGRPLVPADERREIIFKFLKEKGANTKQEASVLLKDTDVRNQLYKKLQVKNISMIESNLTPLQVQEVDRGIREW